MLVYAFREDAPEHARYRDWLDATTASDEPLGLSEIVLSAVVRIMSHPRIFARPEAVTDALDFVEALRAQPNAIIVTPGARH